MLFKILSNVIIDTKLVVALNNKYFELNRRFNKHYKMLLIRPAIRKHYNMNYLRAVIGSIYYRLKFGSTVLDSVGDAANLLFIA